MKLFKDIISENREFRKDFSLDELQEYGGREIFSFIDGKKILYVEPGIDFNIVFDDLTVFRVYELKEMTSTVRLQGFFLTGEVDQRIIKLKNARAFSMRTTASVFLSNNLYLEFHSHGNNDIFRYTVEPITKFHGEMIKKKTNDFDGLSSHQRLKLMAKIQNLK